ncbi:MAG TPA: transcriptional regulator [Syntrophomonas sp.]|jgi:transcriptional regulator with XRE-family HTH domain|nr:transcriptional regulator [Syntrophomonas sp.]
MSLGERLRSAREEKGWKQTYVAKILGITSQSLSNYERGDRDPDTSLLARLADLYEVTTDYLLGRDQIEVKMEIDPEEIKTVYDMDKLAEELRQSLNQALAEGVLTEDQAKQTLDIARQTMKLIIDSKKGQ